MLDSFYMFLFTLGSMGAVTAIYFLIKLVVNTLNNTGE